MIALVVFACLSGMMVRRCCILLVKGTYLVYLTRHCEIALNMRLCMLTGSHRDGNIRYYEYEHDKFEYLAEYKSGEPQRGIAFLPKRGVNVHENEVTRGFKTVADSYIEPIAFIVPRRSEVFQEDIYPPCVGSKPGVSSSDWFGGKNGLPPKISLEAIYDGTEPKDIPSDYKPSAISSPPPSATFPSSSAAAPARTPTVAETPKSTPAAAYRAPAPELKDNKSIATMASKFADKNQEEEEDDEDDSSFEEIPKPVERPSAARTERAPAATRGPEPAYSKPAAVAADPPTSTPTPVSAASRAPPPAASSDAPRTTGAAEGLKGYLSEIKSLLETQGKQIEALTREVGSLKAKLGDGDSDKDARIRQLELELEEARS